LPFLDLDLDFLLFLALPFDFLGLDFFLAAFDFLAVSCPLVAGWC
jgi:hypothetical protein